MSKIKVASESDKYRAVYSGKAVQISKKIGSSWTFLFSFLVDDLDDIVIILENIKIYKDSE